MMSNITKVELTDIDSKLKLMTNGCKDLVIISDFDFTLTHRFYHDGTNLYSSFCAVENYSKLDKEYKEISQKNYEFYAPKEYDLSLSLEERRKFMNDWTEKDLEIGCKSNFERSTYDEIVLESYNKGLLKLRTGADKLFMFANDNNVPIYVLSAGCGDIIIPFLKLTLGNVYDELLKKDLIVVVSNHAIFDDNNKQISYIKPVLNTFNKVDALKQAFRHESSNAIVCGDHHHDSLCVEKLELKNTISFAFINYPQELMETTKKETNERYKLHWDILQYNEASFDYCLDILKSIKDGGSKIII